MTTTNNKTFGPYSRIRQAGYMYFTAGHVGIDATTSETSTDVGAQTTTALDNLAETLSEVGLSMNDVVKTTVFVTDMSDFAAVNEAYVARFNEPRPARSTIAVKELPRVAINGPIKVEIEAIATKTDKTA